MAPPVTVPPVPRYEGEAPSHSALLERREVLQRQHQETIRKVDDLVVSQKQISQELGQDLAAMQETGQKLDALQVREGASGIAANVLSSLVRAFGRRRTILERRSLAEDMLVRYEHVSRKLRQASAFSDELRLTSLQLQQQVEDLHEERGRAQRNELRGAERVVSLDAQLKAIESGAEPVPPTERERVMDRLQFEARTESLSVELYRAQARLLKQELEPARALRDTVLGMHEEMAQFVLAATARVNNAGRRIQALGMAADAPTVIAELTDSLHELDAAMEATEVYIVQAQELLTRVLPEMSRQLQNAARSEALELTGDLAGMSRERARALADRALQEAADTEVEAWLDNKSL